MSKAQNNSLKRKPLVKIVARAYHNAICRPHPTYAWIKGAPMLNFIEALEALGVDFSTVDLSQAEQISEDD